MTEALFLAFQAASGDNHPVHYDVEYCQARGMPGMLAHGFQTLIQTAPGAGLFPFVTEDSLVGFLEQSSRFLKPVFAGDTLYPALEIDELSPNRTTGVVGLRSTVHNQRRETGAGGTAALPAAQASVVTHFNRRGIPHAPNGGSSRIFMTGMVSSSVPEPGGAGCVRSAVRWNVRSDKDQSDHRRQRAFEHGRSQDLVAGGF